MDYCYFIVPNATTSQIGDLVPGERIFAIPTSHPIKMTLSEGEGPFFSLEDLKQLSQIYAQLKKRNPKRAHKIVQSDYINKVEGYLLTPAGTTFDAKILDLWQHIVRGELKSDDITGVHFYDSRFVKITETLNQNEKGVVLANVEVRLDGNENWIPKSEPTTLFPLNWLAQQLLVELDYAYKRKKTVEDGENKYCGKTIDGIEVMFILVGGKMKTAYPIL